MTKYRFRFRQEDGYDCCGEAVVEEITNTTATVRIETWLGNVSRQTYFYLKAILAAQMLSIDSIASIDLDSNNSGTITYNLKSIAVFPSQIERNF